MSAWVGWACRFKKLIPSSEYGPYYRRLKIPNNILPVSAILLDTYGGLKSIGRTQVVPFSDKEPLEVRINHRLQTDPYQIRN